MKYATRGTGREISAKCGETTPKTQGIALLVEFAEIVAFVYPIENKDELHRTLQRTDTDV